MLKHHPKLRKLFRNSEVLSKICGKFTTTKSFDKELIKVVQKEVLKGDRFKELIHLFEEEIY